MLGPSKAWVNTKRSMYKEWPLKRFHWLTHAPASMLIYWKKRGVYLRLTWDIKPPSSSPDMLLCFWNFFYFTFSWNQFAYRTINTSQNFAIKLHERIHGTFDFLFSDLDKLSWNKRTNNGIIKYPTHEFVWKGICTCMAQSFFIQISNLYMSLQIYFSGVIRSHWPITSLW